MDGSKKIKLDDSDTKQMKIETKNTKAISEESNSSDVNFIEYNK